MSRRIGYMFLDNQLTLVVDGVSRDVDPGHPKYREIIAGMIAPAEETPEQEHERAETLLALLEQTSTFDLKAAGAALNVNVRIEHGVIYIGDIPVHNTLTKRILDLQAAGLPYDSFLRFLQNLQLNPSAESREALYDFLEQGKFPLTDDGCFLGYKGVAHGTLRRPDGTEYETLVDCHSHSFDMSPGKSHRMPREAVDNNRNNACGAGFHVGTQAHAQGFGKEMIIVKVNPKDVVSVPLYDKTKLRSCAIESVGMFSSKEESRELSKPVYTQADIEDPTFEQKEKDIALSIQEASAIVARSEYERMTRDDACRLAARRGIFRSTNEARDLGKELVLDALVKGSIPLDDMDAKTLADLAMRRRLAPSARQLLKRGRAHIIELIRSSNPRSSD